MAENAATLDPGSSNRADRMRRSTVTDQIKELILGRQLRPGDLLPTESDLCAQLGVSRTSVREAIRALATLDIVEVRHGHGTFVGKMSLDPMVQALVFRGATSSSDNLKALLEVVEIRQALDVALATRVVEAHFGSADPELPKLVDLMIKRAREGKRFLEADRAFHTLLLEPIDNQLAGQLVGAFWDVHTAVLPRLGLALPSDLRQTAMAHKSMLEAARDGDPDSYRAAVVSHYEPLQRAIRNAR